MIYLGKILTWGMCPTDQLVIVHSALTQKASNWGDFTEDRDKTLSQPCRPCLLYFARKCVYSERP